MTFRVLVPQKIADEGLAELRAAGLEIVEPPDTTMAAMKESIRGCAAVLTRTLPLPAELLREAPELRVISRHGVGVDHIDLDYCRERGIVVTNAPEANTVAVAEHAVMLLLAVTKNVLSCDAAVRRGDFEARNSEFGIELAGRTLGVVGLGRIGRLVASRAAAGFGMEVLGFDPYASAATLDGAVTPVSLEALLARADAVSVHVPLTPATRGLFDARLFSLMKPQSYFINCSRGEVVQQQALEQALVSGRLRAAGLDVFEQEPLPAGSVLAGLPNVVLTPHMAAHTSESMIRMAVHAARGIIAVANHQEPQWPVLPAPAALSKAL